MTKGELAIVALAILGMIVLILAPAWPLDLFRLNLLAMR